MQGTQTFRGLLLAGVVLAALVAAGAATAAPEGQAARITGLVGGVKAGDAEAGQHAVLPEDGRIETQDDGNCAILLDENALLEMCGDSSVQFTRKPGTRNRIVRVDAGEVRMVVEPRAPGERIDIVTPAAVATIMGSIINIIVDPVTGETTLSSTESAMTVRAPEHLQQQIDSSVTVDAAESITLMPGDDPAKLQVRQLDRQALAGLTSCLTDLRDAAVTQDRVLSMSKAQERVSTADSEAVNEVDVAAAAGVPPAPAPPTDPIVDPQPPPPSPPPPTDLFPEVVDPPMPPMPDLDMMPGRDIDPGGDDGPPGGPALP